MTRKDVTRKAVSPSGETAPAGGWKHGPASGIPAGGDGHGPARNLGTRPPFPDGNTLHVTHGSRSPRVYLPLAADLAAGLLDARPDLAPYPVAVARWAEWEARALLMRRHLAAVGDMTGTGPKAEPRKGATRWLRECETAAERAAAVLGLDPRSEATLARERAAASHLAVDLHAVAARGAAILAEREAAAAADPDHPDHLPEPDPVALALERVKAAGRETWERADREHNAARNAATTPTGPTTPSDPSGGER